MITVYLLQFTETTACSWKMGRGEQGRGHEFKLKEGKGS